MVSQSEVRKGFFDGILEELKKVTWPSKNEVIKLSLVVIIISLIIAFYIGALDVILAKLLEFLTK
ncbi:preprotein translocase subunit SecE [Candidatus Roizmanbacteria bacterium RIFCSPHIGHO2_12_FULL_33_9]|uniref:Protein translocase subunit SecE n=1 Tax=Candidatus Roizmanbacteria bacterium RIFCSPHIGHO2_12_FULL_33_9 TaxID=1802045 RepID=A0A1F7HIM5_9BACT|nr:MAG: preprotein translocase subunit SecE [Candidatus Roizmanbacteria bacterium RIFCSPHIGHO2_12_FULL_33_9]